MSKPLNGHHTPNNVEADNAFMREALALAAQAGLAGEVPIGALIVSEGRIIGRGKNEKETRQDPCGHAEIAALQEAAKAIGTWRLRGTTLYSTLEPCIMCAGALIHARVARLVYGCRDPKWGGIASLYTIAADERLNHQIVVCEGVCAEEARTLLQDFFRARRKES